MVDLHSPPGGHKLGGGYAGSDHGLFTDAACQRAFVEVWRQMARKYKDAKAVWGYDLANEPVESAVDEDLDDWQDLAERAAKAIRQIDPARAIIVEPAPWGSPEGLYQLRPLAVSNVVYSVHMYLPTAFTHQGVFGPGKACRYPGQIEGKPWDKAQLEAALRPVVEVPAEVRRPYLPRRVQRDPLGARGQCLPLPVGPDRHLRGARLGLELPCLPRMGRLERGTRRRSLRSPSRRLADRPGEAAAVLVRQEPQARGLTRSLFLAALTDGTLDQCLLER